ncbi:DUF2790 domain-containing protein [Pseudomonas gingeri]|uniref:DUF2790 domain-containing protein n=1 Tax=Pseudomonas gingeri TaxID=117681 RepID=A0A7Y7YDE8_9PSED|nr:DUF2790 domain-containing protein [Pseudomonas gingeri]NWA05467.1 DUF2790 domain-containing protein [Pseudomonas gingeri]NWA18074.1 DUF2790 domain-containing protein [Pseudomonas gingeri]NWA59038.1 DUF2790 domain-containing protein [Pseudomonas gingeri]NWA99638.1 DUF2790 domain-containing protein [Pseudomonas gingeri]NWB06193.1 DUF2790 domain-containing protein [Pseudomonas gingeri]
MKLFAALILSSLCATAMADEASTDAASQNLPVEEYTYSSHPDIHKVISMSEIPDVCEVVPARMVYEDAKGDRHVMEYRVMGNGCSNG